MPKTHEIISMEAGTTKNSGSKMWRCQTATGERVNIFENKDAKKDSFHLFADAGYSDLLLLENGKTWTWKAFPIGIEMIKEGEYFNITAVEPRPDGANPDKSFVPNLELYRSQAVEWAGYITDVRLFVCAFDQETTGVGLDDEIVSISVFVPKLNFWFNSLVQPEDPDQMILPKWGNGLSPADKTGITPEMLRAAPTLNEIYADLVGLMAGRIWVTYNSDFDVRLLNQSCHKYGLPLIPSIGVNDAMRMFSQWFGEWDEVHSSFAWKKLEFACEQLGVELGESHKASEDTSMMWRMILAMAMS